MASKKIKVFLKRNTILDGGIDGFANTVVSVDEKGEGKTLIGMKKAEPYEAEIHDKLIADAKKKAESEANTPQTSKDQMSQAERASFEAYLDEQEAKVKAMAEQIDAMADAMDTFKIKLETCEDNAANDRKEIAALSKQLKATEKLLNDLTK